MPSSEQRIETVRFGAYGPGAADNFDEWAGHSPNHRHRRIDDSRFSAAASFWQLDRFVLTEQRLDAFAAERSPDRLSAVPTNQVTLVALFEGDLTYRSGATEQLCCAGEIVLLDFKRSYAFVTTAQHSATVSMDRRMLEDDVGVLGIHGPLVATPETRMLADFIATLVRQLPDMAASSAVPAATVLRRLIALALRSGSRGAEPPTLMAERTRALAYIEQQPFGTFDVEEMSASLNLTRSTLYRMFRADGGVLSYDRRRRLRLLHRDLCEARDNTPLGELGAHYGFFDLSNLSRQFKAQFGLSMSDVRKHLLPRLTRPGSIGRYREAIGRFE